MPTVQEIYERSQAHEPVWFVNVLNFQYYCDAGYIVAMRMEVDAVPLFHVEIPSTGEIIELLPLEIYFNEQEATIKAQELQKKHGRVLITQKEYDELLQLKQSTSSENS